MPLALVTMTHSALPGVTKGPVSRKAYRSAWYDVGWRSPEDPDWSGMGSVIDTAHQTDNSLHGGGVEEGYAERTTDTGNLAVTVFTMTAVPSLIVTVPVVDRPVYLHGHVHVRHSVAAATSAVLFAPVGSSSITDARGPAYVTHRATGSFVTAKPFHRIPPGGGGQQWQVFVTGDSGNVVVVASSAAPSSVRAETA